MQVYSDIGFISKGVRQRLILIQSWMYIFLGRGTDTDGSRAVRSFFVRGDVLRQDTY